MSVFPALPTGSSRNKIEFLYDLLKNQGGGSSQTLLAPISTYSNGSGDTDKTIQLGKSPFWNAMESPLVDTLFFNNSQDGLIDLSQLLKSTEPTTDEFLWLTFNLSMFFKLEVSDPIAPEVLEAELKKLRVKAELSMLIDAENSVKLGYSKITPKLAKVDEPTEYGFALENEFTLMIDPMKLDDWLTFGEGKPVRLDLNMKIGGDSGNHFDAGLVKADDHFGVLRFVGFNKPAFKQPPPPVEE